MNSPVNPLKKLKLTIFNSNPNSVSQPSANDHQLLTQSSSSASPSSSATSSSAFVPSSANQIHPLSHHLPGGNGFRNPWPSAASSSQFNLNNLISNGIPLQLAKKPPSDLQPVRTLPADLKLYVSQSEPSSPSPLPDKLVSTWLGHAGYLVQLPMLSRALANQKLRPFRILFDPMFSIRAGPTQWTGPKRLKPSPCHIKQIPAVDICLISHSHYDHLDYDTIQELSHRQPHLKYFVPLGLKSWFDCVSVPSEQVVELDWWQSRDWNPAHVRSSQQPPLPDRPRRQSSPVGDTCSIRITCVPAQHSSGRSLLDQNTSLWCGWVVEQLYSGSLPFKPEVMRTSSPDVASLLPPNPGTTPSSSSPQLKPNDHRNRRRKCCVYFAGDTGYRSPQDRDLICPAFKEIGERFGPIDFSMIPIWRGGSLSFVSWAGFRISDPNLLVAHHASPEDAIRIHQDVQSKHSIGIHHSCFVGNDLESLEALAELNRAKELYKIGSFNQPFGFGVVDVGETVEIDL
ncbi:hypothetical protein PCANC_14934 [Puccinia coronata f. sp. avenae]|uniref:Metallo-beta-lactamase domain-containing protein n=1 Tax=Puccinia coronata f. sp. avenae TaxID=200324 RepID=A0A2N5TUJ6_9BASI|nr:hypothetical protein PCANC_14934 [Puccinia coronata f. sp. avenae]PLW29154.1 hypothetical protein PCASD_10926 [Puccinia coronata f. sp. avenae]